MFCSVLLYLLFAWETWVSDFKLLTFKHISVIDMLKFHGEIAICGHFYWCELTLIPAWISNHTPSKVWDEITYPFLNFNSCTIEV